MRDDVVMVMAGVVAEFDFHAASPCELRAG
jgi:hypothetical protein